MQGDSGPDSAPAPGDGGGSDAAPGPGGWRDDRAQRKLDLRFELPRFISFSELLRATNQTFAKHFAALVALVLMVGLPLDVASGLTDRISEQDEVWGLLYLVWTPLEVLAAGLFAAVAARLTVATARGESGAGLGTGLSWGLGVMLPVAGWTLLYWLICLAGLLAVVVGAVLLYIWLALTPVVAAVDGGQIGRSPIKRAWELGKSYRGWITGVLVLPILVGMGLGFVIGVLQAGVGIEHWFLDAAGATLGRLIAMWSAVGLTLVYLSILGDQRDEAPVCQACGYDLTANTSGFCPECGEPAYQPATADAGGPAEPWNPAAPA